MQSVHPAHIPPLCSRRLPQCVSERLVEGALVCGARRKPVHAEGARGPAATGHRGAPQRSRGGDRRPRPQTPLLLLHPAGGQWTGIFRGTTLLTGRGGFSFLGSFSMIVETDETESSRAQWYHFSSNHWLCLCATRRPAQRIWAAGWVSCLQRQAAPRCLKSCTTTTSTWTRSLTSGTPQDTPSCELLPAECARVLPRVIYWNFLWLGLFSPNSSVCVVSPQLGHDHCDFLLQRLDRLQNIWRGLWKCGGKKTPCEPVIKYDVIKHDDALKRLESSSPLILCSPDLSKLINSSWNFCLGYSAHVWFRIKH